MAERIGDRVDDGRRSRDGAGFAAALDPERVRRAGRHRHADLEGRQVDGARHAVVVEAGRDELAALVVDGTFEERLTDALGDAAMNLAFDDHRVDDHPEIVHRRPALDLGHARVGVDLYLADVDAGREGEVGGIVERSLLQAGLQILARELVGDVGLQRDFAEGQRPVGAGHAEPAVLELDVALGRFEHMGRHLLALGDHLVERLGDGRHADGAGARAVGAHAELHLVGVAVDDADLIDGDAEPVARRAGRRWSRGPGHGCASR